MIINSDKEQKKQYSRITGEISLWEAEKTCQYGRIPVIFWGISCISMVCCIGYVTGECFAVSITGHVVIQLVSMTTATSLYYVYCRALDCLFTLRNNFWSWPEVLDYRLSRYAPACQESWEELIAHSSKEGLSPQILRYWAEREKGALYPVRTKYKFHQNHSVFLPDDQRTGD